MSGATVSVPTGATDIFVDDSTTAGLGGAILSGLGFKPKYGKNICADCCWEWKWEWERCCIYWECVGDGKLVYLVDWGNGHGWRSVLYFWDVGNAYLSRQTTPIVLKGGEVGKSSLETCDFSVMNKIMFDVRSKYSIMNDVSITMYSVAPESLEP